MQIERFSALVTVHILFLRDKDILLSLRNNISSHGLYGLVAGHLDGGETVIEASIREAREEVGVVIDPEDIEFATVCHSYNKKNNREIIQFYFICRKWNGEFKNNELDKCADIRFFPLSDLPTNMVPYIQDSITKIMHGVKYYEYGWHGEE